MPETKERRFGEGVPLLMGERNREGSVSPPQNFFLFSSSQMVRFGAFWVLFFTVL